MQLAEPLLTVAGYIAMTELKRISLIIRRVTDDSVAARLEQEEKRRREKKRRRLAKAKTKTLSVKTVKSTHRFSFSMKTHWWKSGNRVTGVLILKLKWCIVMSDGQPLDYCYTPGFLQKTVHGTNH